MKKHIKRLFPIIFLSLVLTGCWDSLDIKDRNMATAVITDYKDGDYTFTIEIADIKGEKSSNAFSISKGSGRSFPEARDDIDRKFDNPIFLGSTSVVILGEGLAKQGIEEYMNRVRGTMDYRKSIDVVTSSEDPEAILARKPENDLSVGFSIEDTIQSNYDLGMSVHVTFGSVLEALADEKVGFVLNDFGIDQGENTLIAYSVFKDAKLIGKIPAVDSKGLVYLLRNDASFIYDVNIDDKIVTYQVKEKNKKVIPVYDEKTKKVKLNIQMEVNSIIQYINKPFDLNKDLEAVYNSKLEEILTRDLNKAIYDSQKNYACDYLQCTNTSEFIINRFLKLLNGIIPTRMQIFQCK